MRFFGGDEPLDAEGDRSGELENGGLPSAAQERLAQLTGGTGMFTSTLSTAEFALLGEHGVTPVAQLMGASVFQVGWQYLPPEAQWGGSTYTCELVQVSGAWSEARRRAFDRLREEARLAGADAVVGVRMHRGEHDWTRRAVDLVISGTGVRYPARTEAAPVLSDLSAQQFWLLRTRGWAPAGLVAATSAVFATLGFAARWRRRLSTARNQELHEFSRAFTTAREAAVRELSRAGRQLGAEGIVGVSFDHSLTRRAFTVAVPPGSRGGTLPTRLRGGSRGGGAPTSRADKRDGLVITVHAVGTAITRSDQGTPADIRPTVNLGIRT